MPVLVTDGKKFDSLEQKGSDSALFFAKRWLNEIYRPNVSSKISENINPNLDDVRLFVKFPPNRVRPIVHGNSIFVLKINERFCHGFSDGVTEDKEGKRKTQYAGVGC